MSTTTNLPEPLTVHAVYAHWGQVLDTLDVPTDDHNTTSAHVRLTIYRYGRPHISALSPALYAHLFAEFRDLDPEPPVTIPPADASPWRLDLTDPRAPRRVAIASRGAQRSWSEIHTQVSRRRMQITVLRDGSAAGVFVPLSWPNAAVAQRHSAQ